MTDRRTDGDWLADWALPERAGEGAGAGGCADGEWVAGDVEGGPARAEQFRITDMQHWIDLCA